MGPVTVAHLLYIFLRNWNHSQSLEEERKPRMFLGTTEDLLRCAPGRVGIFALGKKKEKKTFLNLGHHNRREIECIVSFLQVEWH